MPVNMTFSEAACAYIKKVVEKEQGVGFRLSIKKTGCSGYAYLPSVITAVKSTDTVYALPNGMTVYIDTAWLHLLENLQVDYIEEAKSGLKQKRLVFVNPNESGRCGCGESFHVE